MDKLTKGDYIIFVVSEGFLDSPWCMYELALTADYPDYKARVFQIRLPGVKLDTALQVAQLVEAWQDKWEELKKTLDRMAARNESHVADELKEELRIAGEIVKGSGKALSHLRGTMGVMLPAGGKVDLAVMEKELRRWIRLPGPIQKLVDDMVFVEGGMFMMGADDGNGREREMPVHEVNLGSFYIGKYPVTQAQWEAVMGTNPSHFKEGVEAPKRPVERVSWHDCKAFLEKLNALTGLKFRLPTEAEWEYAARGGTKRSNFRFSGSDRAEDVAWFSLNSNGITHPTGEKQANEIGLHDMSGNIWEWCADWYDNSYYQSSPKHNPTGPSKGAFALLRGGSFGNGSIMMRTTLRYFNDPEYLSHNVGFRVARN